MSALPLVIRGTGVDGWRLYPLNRPVADLASPRQNCLQAEIRRARSMLRTTFGKA